MCSYHSKFEPKESNGNATRFMFHCAQLSARQKKPQKSEDLSKHRDKEAMLSFDCEGWLHITVWDGSDIVRIRLGHCLQHVPYWSIDVPDDIRQYVEQNFELRPTEVCDHSMYKVTQISDWCETVPQLWSEIVRRHLPEKPNFS